MYRAVKLVTTLRLNLGRRFCDSRPPLGDKAFCGSQTTILMPTSAIPRLYRT